MSRLQICADCKAYLQFCVCADRAAMERRHAGEQTEDDEECTPAIQEPDFTLDDLEWSEEYE
jgi:hypothetical protein